MRPDYKNWMPKGMITALSFAGGITGIIGVVANLWGRRKKSRAIETIGAILAILSGIIQIVVFWMRRMYDAFSYLGERQMAKQIVEGTAEFINMPDGGKGLDVGCGSGALTIACAKRNPNAMMIGVDRWGKDYASFSRTLCEENAEAEKVYNVSFRHGDANVLGFPEETFDAVTSNYVYHNVVGADRQQLLRETLRTLKKGGTFAIHDIMSKAYYGDMKEFCEELRKEGYEKVELIPTWNGMFMSRWEAIWMMLGGSALLVGKK